MKSLTLFFLVCTICCSLQGQNHQRDVLYYSDTLARGEFKYFGDARVHFYPYGANKKIKIPNRAVDSLLLTDEEGITKTHYRVLLRRTDGKPFVVVKNCLVKGPMSLFEYYSSGTNPLPLAGPGGFGGGAGSFGAFGSFGGTTVERYVLYLVTPKSLYAQEKIITPRFKRKKLIPWLKEQFANCPQAFEAIEKPRSKHVEENLVRLVKIYNQHCAPNLNL